MSDAVMDRLGGSLNFSAVIVSGCFLTSAASFTVRAQTLTLVFLPVNRYPESNSPSRRPDNRNFWHYLLPLISGTGYLRMVFSMFAQLALLAFEKPDDIIFMHHDYNYGAYQ